MDTDHIEVGRRAEGPILAGQCQAGLVAAEMKDTVVGSRVAEAPIPPDQCQVRLVEVVTEAADTAAGRQEADRAGATPEADRMAALPMEDTITTK